MKSEVLEKTGKKVVLLGNEAIARGALEAGVGVVTAYPGTPSSEVPMVLSGVAKDLGFYFEYSTNEKVALETAAGAAWSGVRSLVAMKHFGLNVASDSLIPIAYTGTRAGLVIMVADDPQGWSSIQSEQDSRYYARLAKLPTLEPSNPQECLEFTKFAFELSEEFEIPVLLRTTTKVSHSISTVTLGELGEIRSRGKFEKDPKRFYNFRPQLQVIHKKLNKKIEQIELSSRRSSRLQPALSTLNRVFSGEGKIGIITSGVGFEYVNEATKELSITPPIAKIGLTHPLSGEFIGNFIKDKKAVLVVEELEPILEDFVKIVAKDINPNLEVLGKNLLPKVGEYNLEIVISFLAGVFGKKLSINFVQHKKAVDKTLEDLPPRKPVFCPGCPHRSTFYAVKKVFSLSTRSMGSGFTPRAHPEGQASSGFTPRAHPEGQAGAIYAGDIGCYMMGVFEPYKMQDFIISMGAGLGLAHGISKVSDQKIVAFIGDSTFFHAGMPALLNCKFNDSGSLLVVVLDNGITAMTGHQPHPGSGFTGMGEKVEVVKIEDVVAAFGVEVKVANAFNQKELVEALEELKKVQGPKVLVSRGECRLLTKRRFRKEGIPLPKFEIIDEEGFEKSDLMEEFSCPAMVPLSGMEKIDGLTGSPQGGKYRINPDLCWGCGVCQQICPKGIKPKRKENPPSPKASAG